MSHILIERVRIKNFRALKNVEVALNPITLLTGANNAGKTTFLRALNAVLGVSRSMLNKDDLFIDQAGRCLESQIIIDLKFIAVDEHGARMPEFHPEWVGVFAGENIESENNLEFFAIRASFNFQGEDMPEAQYSLITNWEQQILGPVGDFKRIQQLRSNIRMYYIDAQRDIEEDVRLRTSYFGKMASRLEDDYAQEDIEALSDLISKINSTAVDKSPILKHLKETLTKLNHTTQTRGAGVDLTPFSRNIRDLHKGMRVDFQDHGSERFSMEYHGMGTRSWASILTAGAYIEWELDLIKKKMEEGKDTNLLFPIIALEEPEAHLHPNAQRTLYGQMKGFLGQKIISTHSPYIAGQAGLEELRHFYKEGDTVLVNQINIATLSIKDLETIKNVITDSRGEVLFSKIVVMGEGPTEEVLLSTLGSSYFGKSNFELGINIVGVGQNYPLIHLLKFLKIKWFIFSDYDTPQIKSDLKSLINNHKIQEDCIIKLNNEDTTKPLEEYLYDEGYEPELKSALKKIKEPEYYNKQHRAKKQEDVAAENLRIDNLSKESFLKELKDWKVKAARIYSQQILLRSNPDEKFPAKIRELFEKIKQVVDTGLNEAGQ
jgi:putative ATP-dependent endonuclease of OLD family